MAQGQIQHLALPHAAFASHPTPCAINPILHSKHYSNCNLWPGLLLHSVSFFALVKPTVVVVVVVEGAMPACSETVTEIL